jgi:hypothetical protein
MRLFYFILGAICISATIGLTSGELQNHIQFNSVDSEILMTAFLCIGGIFLLSYSLQRDEK